MASQHISKKYNNELEALRTQLLTMGGMVEQQLMHSLKALFGPDAELAKLVIKKEDEVNEKELDIDQGCIKILATRQPAAGDLRLIMAIIRTITDLERVGDEAQKIARFSLQLSEKQEPKAYYTGIDAMGALSLSMIHDALDAFARMNSKAALTVAGQSKTSDKKYSAIIRELVTYMMEDPRHISGAIDAVMIARALERIGDHARNICEHVIYIVEGKDVRHSPLEDIEKAVY